MVRTNSASFSSPTAASDSLTFVKRDRDCEEEFRRISERDVFELALQGLYAGTATLLPQRSWAGMARRVALLRIAKHRRKGYDRFSASLQATFGTLETDEIDALFIRWRSRLHERRLLVMANLLSPVCPEFSISGRAALDRSVAAGKGVILWSLQSAFQTLAGKRGLHEAGYRISQVSSSVHGPCHTAFGKAITNRSAIQAENRYLAGRLVFETAEGSSMLRQALRLLKDGGTVNFTNTTFSGRSFVKMPFGVSGFVQMPLAPVALAAAQGIPLHVVSTVETAPFAAYRIDVSDDLTACLHGDKRRDHAALAPVFLAARDQLLAMVKAYPDQFLVWSAIRTDPTRTVSA
ncbi:hypothetical protein [Paragemmobacter aquarius]|uniref:hypothetical protein n=1 Tax=Paragemmobacter aquarius TaxID=2169400 RepID=UPI00131F3642|nr:hypothetical protein [Gemmobacter aquarius]